MDNKVIIYGAAIILVLFLGLVSAGLIKLNFGGKASANSVSSGSYANMPEECRPPAGQDITAWKEHLGHHAETQDCLKYFN
ncbi:MAG: hypothetical protein AABW51_01825 [Nanoarchaeota archaeon]